jgi:excisionase family DNA binding protein
MSTIYNENLRVKLQKHYRIKDAADMCAVSEKTMYRWIYDRRVKAHKIGGSVRIPQGELMRIIEDF